MKTSKRIAIAGLSLAILGIIAWEAHFHGTTDPRDLQYIGWKIGIFPFDPDRALGTMILDTHRDKIVLGKTEDELKAQFVYVRAVSADDAHYKDCFKYFGHSAGGRLLTLRDTDWVVLMKNDHVAALTLAKGGC